MDYPNSEIKKSDVEERITGEFMTGLQESDVSFDIIEVMEGLIDEEDFGGKEEIVSAIDSDVMQNDD
jgi:hypothetical protein